MERLVREAGLGEAIGPRPRFVHVAGTNGKGSVTAFAQAILVAMGRRTGGYFSPYVVDPRERVQIGGELIEKAEFARLTSRLWPIAERIGEVTEFEFKTALGFLAWQEAKCEWVALEVGLGGRFDATNVVTSRVSVIVSISLDHTAILGRTEREIAFEKAGILKPGVPAVLGATIVGEAREAILAVAAERGAPIVSPVHTVRPEDGGRFTISRPEGDIAGLRPGIVGPHSGTNAALALDALRSAGLRPTDDEVRIGIERARLPGRGEIRKHGGRTIMLDGAHNVGSASAVPYLLKDERAGNTEGAILVTNMLSGHDADAFFSAIASEFREAIVVPIDFPRALSPEETAIKLRNLGLYVTLAESVREGLDLATERGPVVVTGSFYLVGEALRALDQDT